MKWYSKALSMLLVLAMICSFMCLPAFAKQADTKAEADAIISVDASKDNLIESVGDELVLPVNIEFTNAEARVNTFLLTVNYDSKNLELTEITAALSRKETGLIRLSVSEGGQAGFITSSKNDVLSKEMVEDEYWEGLKTLFWLKFTAKEGYVNGKDYKISLSLTNDNESNFGYAAGSIKEYVDVYFEPATIELKGGIPETDVVPQFAAELTGKTYTYGDETPTLDATATVKKSDGAVSYQWYEKANPEAEGVAIEDKTEATLKPVAQVGTPRYFYCVATNVYNGVTYTNTTEVSVVTCQAKTLTAENVTVTEPTYTGSELAPTVTVAIGGTELAEDTDYTVTVTAKTEVNTSGKYTLTVEGKGNYTGKIEADWNVKNAAITVTGEKELAVYNNGKSYDWPIDEIKTVNGQPYTIEFAATNPDLVVFDKDTKQFKGNGTTGDTNAMFTITAPNHAKKFFPFHITVSNKANVGDKIRFELVVEAPTDVYTGTEHTLDKFVKAAEFTGTGKITYTVAYTPVGGETVTAEVANLAEYTVLDAGTYKVTANYEDEEQEGSKSVSFTIAKAIVEGGVPKAEGNLVYNGDVLTGVKLPENAPYTLSGNTGTDAGSYTAVATLTNPNNYKWAAGSTDCEPKEISWTIAKAAIAAADEPAKAAVVPYTGSEQQGVTFKAGFGYGIVGGMETTHATDAGTYKAAFVLDANHTWSDGTTANKVIEWSIEKATITVDPDEIKWNYTKAYTYDGNEKTVELTGLVDMLQASYSGNTGINAGKYTASAELSVKADYAKNYKISGSVENLNWEIERAPIDSAKEPKKVTNSLTYTGSEQTGITYVTDAGYDCIGGAVKATDAGDNYSATFAVDDNHKWADGTTEHRTIHWAISKAQVEVPTVADQTFDNTDKTGVVDHALYNVGGTNSAKDVGSYEASVSLENKDNYEWKLDTHTSENQTVVWNIVKAAAVNMTEPHPATVRYDAGKLELSLDTLLPGAKVTSISNLNGVSGIVAAAELKDGKLVVTLADSVNKDTVGQTATISFTAASQNYADSNLSVKLTITSKTDVKDKITFNGGTVTYNGQAQKPADATIDLTASGEPTWKYEIKKGEQTVTEMKDAGTYTVTAIYEDDDNYGVSEPVEFKIEQAELTITGAAVAVKDYNGETNDAAVSDVTFSGYVNSETLTADDYTVSNAAYVSANAGTQNVTFTVTLKDTAVAKNYKLAGAAGTASGVINVLDLGKLTASLAQPEYTYSGSAIEPAVTVEVEGTVGGYQLVEGTDYTVGYDANTDVGTATVTVTAKSGSNYTFTVDALTFTIEPAALTDVTVEAVTVDYTGEALTAAIIKGVAKFNGTPVPGTWAIMGNSEIKNAGNYMVTAVFTPDSDNFNAKEASFIVIINKVKVPVPTARTGLVYNGKVQNGVKGQPELMTWEGVASNVNAGNFSAEFSLKDPANYVWADGSEGTKTVDWSIAKATPTGAPEYTKINGQGKTLADVNLKIGTLPEGTIIWVDENGNALPLTTKVETNKKYTWKFTPASDNYTERTGEITPCVYIPSTVPMGSQVSTVPTQNGKVVTSAVGASTGTTVYVTVTPDTGYKVGAVIVTDALGNVIPVTDLGNGKYSFQMPATAVSVGAKFASAQGASFIDVPAYEWYYNAVYYAYENGLMNGVGDGTTFAPTAKLTRAMLMTILARLDGVDTNGGEFWYSKGMEWAKANGISDGTNPNGNITREQTVTMLFRYAQYKGVDVSVGEDTNILSYNDAFSVSEWAIPAMQWACGDGMIQGNGGKLNPTGNASRAEIATMLMRFIENVIK